MTPTVIAVVGSLVSGLAFGYLLGGSHVKAWKHIIALQHSTIEIQDTIISTQQTTIDMQRSTIDIQTDTTRLYEAAFTQLCTVQ